MKLDISELKKVEGKFLSYNTRTELGSFGNEIVKNDTIFLDVQLEAAYVPRRVLIKGKWLVEIMGECSRCLEKIVLVLKEELYDQFTQLKGIGEPGEGMARTDGQNGEGFVFSGDMLDLKEYFRQLVIMSMPLRMLCSEDCRGLCPACGVNRNTEECSCRQKSTDPRWAMLQQIKKE